MSLACGIDVGGTKIAGGVVDEDGTIVEELRVESPATDAEAIEEAIAGLVTRAALAPRRSRPSAWALPGYINKARAVVFCAPNVAWRNEDLKAKLEKRCDLHNQNRERRQRRRLGEFTFGAGHDADDLLLVTVGTGVGGGLVLDGEVYRGANGAVGAEIGHMRVVPNGILLRLREARLLRAVRQRLGPGARGPCAGDERRDDRAGHAQPGRRRPQQDHRAADHRGRPARRRGRAPAARRTRPLARRGHRVADRDPGPRRGGNRRWCQ